ncbi:maleylpyruvate isomerase N-terminal domain-containing protein [Actinotalea sp. M2MS4P-6]|uniref:maleylpyruvate isomerase N-terminal domain-containing protein n=1 Tax=Actinotalea sp. M2MS4P-6 TaxID=2983762 RepID=UPI0021E4F72D|nr:maleylpyruvate isomerase N-terminal domain-containing protein [Actinotalea sp. M2MS4P-6]MCV2393630.1 maleylpyruvate isomerase N-terminal domain-containing protein [Actinotalea sp. M2MS4P-6]
MNEEWRAAQRVFAAAAGWFVDMADRVGDRWAEPGLGEWDVRALVGHTSRSLLTVEEYLARPTDTVDVASTSAYYVATRAIAAGPGVAQRGRDAGTALGEDPVAGVREIAARVLPVVAAADGTELLTTIAGGMRLADYLPTRSFELTVHTLDLAAALDVAAQPPPDAAREAMRLVADLAVHDGTAATILLATTGRRGLPPGFTVL